MSKTVYRPIYKTRKATESNIQVLTDEIAAVGSTDGASMGYMTAISILHHLQELRSRLWQDLRYFDEIDKAMEEAVK